MGMRRFAHIAGVAAVLITTATLVLRYHYFVDFAASPSIVAFGAWFGGFYSPATYRERLDGVAADDVVDDDADGATAQRRHLLKPNAV